MNISKDALLRIVKAARAAIGVSETLNKLLVERKAWTWADEIYGNLSDALFIMSGETLTPQQEFFNDSQTIRLLKSDMSDGAVADWFIMMDKLNHRINDIQQPEPNISNKEDLERLSKQVGAYQHKPEGDAT